MSVDPLWTLPAQYFLALLFVIGGAHKIAQWPRFCDAVRAYELVPTRSAGKVAAALLSAELIFGVGLLLEPFKMWVASSAAGLLLLYGAAMAVNLARGRREIDCGCALWRKKAPLSGRHLIRNALLISLALVVLWPSSGRALSALDAVQIVAAVLSLALIYWSAESLLANQSHERQKGVLR